MTGRRRFVDSFWETDFNGTLGFELICKGIRDGHKSCRDIEEFLKKKAKAQQHYAKQLRTITKSTEGREETGALGTCWLELKNQTDKTAKYHEDAAADLAKLADDIARLADEIKSQYKQTEDKVKEKQKNKRNAHGKVTELQRTYHEKCRDMIQHENQYETAKQSVTTSSKEMEKSKSRAEKSREAQEKADNNYRQAVDALELIRVSWEEDMVEACEVFQKMEEDRRYKVRDLLWRCTNIDSQLCVDWDESCEQVRFTLEKCSVRADIDDFISKNMTGTQRPAPVCYENYFEESPKPGPSRSPAMPRKRHPPLGGLPAIPASEYASPYDNGNKGNYSYAYVT